MNSLSKTAVIFEPEPPGRPDEALFLMNLQCLMLGGLGILRRQTTPHSNTGIQPNLIFLH
jgi:hypothetical protein